MLFNTSQAFGEIKNEILSECNLHSIISLPAGVFLPYSGVKTNIIFFDRNGPTQDIWYYEIDLGRKLTKNKPITYDEIRHIPELLKKRALTEYSWIVNVNDIKDFDLSAKNPQKNTEEILRKPEEIMREIEGNTQEIEGLLREFCEML